MRLLSACNPSLGMLKSAHEIHPPHCYASDSAHARFPGVGDGVRCGMLAWDDDG